MDVDLSFLILCPDRNRGGLRNTVGSITSYAWNRPSICVVGEDATAAEVKELKEFCPTYKGENTITSLINVGMKKIKTDWAFILFSGSRIPTFLEHKLRNFVKEETDVLFPVVDRKWDFISGSFNGVLINTKFFKKAGEFPTVSMQKQGMNDFEMAKMFWALGALEAGVTFKAIVGMRII